MLSMIEYRRRKTKKISIYSHYEFPLWLPSGREIKVPCVIGNGSMPSTEIPTLHLQQTNNYKRSCFMDKSSINGKGYFCNWHCEKNAASVFRFKYGQLYLKNLGNLLGILEKKAIFSEKTYINNYWRGCTWWKTTMWNSTI